MSNDERSLIITAQKTNSIKELEFLSFSPYSNVRVSVAKNAYATVAIINRLAQDCVARVSYWATKNNKCQVRREFRDIDLQHKCILCTKDESTFHTECLKCV